MKDRPGFVSVSGMLVGAVVLLGLVVWTVLMGAGMFSPGALSSARTSRTLGGVASHAALGHGCEACHTAPWSSETMADRCLGCHQDVRAQIRSRNGLHGALVGGRASDTCRGCHTEHHGPTAALTVIDEAAFPHELLGYSLRGHQRTATGARFTCADCHPSALARFDQATCARCHASLDARFMSQHESTFGRSCLPCHDGSDRFGSDFNHDKLPFKLEGKHAGLACTRCHTDTRSLRALQATPRDCHACHAKDDRHAGRFGKQCGQCHNPKDWGDAKFDHGIFPLSHGSEERTATCQTCHPTDVSRYTCYGCHEHTPATVQADHEGQALSSLTDCIRCHPGGRKRVATRAPSVTPP